MSYYGGYGVRRMSGSPGQGDRGRNGDVLIHYGIKGQTWGVRRFQNEDGTLTAEGRARYDVGDGERGFASTQSESGQLRPRSTKESLERGRKAAQAIRKAREEAQSRSQSQSQAQNSGQNGDANSTSLTDREKAALKREYKQSQKDGYHRIIQQEKVKGITPNKRRQELTERYKQQGMTQNEAEVAALKRENVEKVVKVAGAVALTAAVAYGAYKGHQWLAKNADRTIKSGSDIYRVARTADEDINRAAYVANNSKDAMRYKGLYGQQIKQQQDQQSAVNALRRMFGGGDEIKTAGDGVYQLRAKANQNIKVAGDRKANKVYQELLKSDKQFAADNEAVRKTWDAVGRHNGNAYEDFNARLVDHSTPEAQRVQNRFYEALKKRGYGGVMDVNDRDKSGYNTKKPVILFNLKNSIGNATVSKISNEDINANYEKAYDLIMRENRNKELVKAGGRIGASYAGAVGAIGATAGIAGGTSVAKQNRAAKTRSAKYQQVIREYKREHPNTKLSDKQILENELG